MATEFNTARTVDESARRKFESAWRDGKPISIEHCLPAQSHKLYLPTLEELIYIDLEFAWKRQTDSASDVTHSGPPRVEHYLTRFELLNQPHIILRLLRQECSVRRLNGNLPTQSELRQRFPLTLLADDDIHSLVGPTTTPGAVLEGNGAPDELTRYQLLKEHASGGFGTIWKASDDKLGRQVAVKQLRQRLATQPEMRQRFAREARICARLEHPGVVPVYDAGNLGAGRPFYTMKFIQGETLADAIARFHALPWLDASRRVERLKLLSFFLSVARTMEYAHSRGVIHRDLKPQNVVLGDFGEAYVVDWGLAKVLGESDSPQGADPPAPHLPTDMAVTLPGTVQGTPAYMSPEQAAGNIEAVDEQSDIYALGAMLYQLLTGKLAVQGESRQGILEQVQAVTPPRPRSIDRRIHPGLEAICLKAMAKRKADRYASVAEVSRDLQSYLADEPVSAWREPLSTKVARWARRHRTLVAASVVALVLLAVGGGAFVYLSELSALRTAETLRADQALAEAEIHAGRLESAQSLLANAAQRLGSQSRFRGLKADLSAQHDRVQTLIAFWRHADQAWFQAGEERETEALEAIAAARANMGIKAEGDWWRGLAVQDLTQEQQTEVVDEIHRLYLLEASLLTKTAVMRFADPVGAADCKQALVALHQAQKYRPSNYSRLVENFCYFRLGDESKISTVKEIEPRDPDDFFFFGFIYMWMGQFPDNQESKLVRMIVRKLSGLEFENPLAKGQAYFKKAAELQPHRFWHHFMVGWAESVGRDYAQAELAFTTCVALRPNYPPGYVGRGSMKIAQGRASGDKALEAAGYADFDKAVEIDPSDSWTYWMRGQVADPPRYQQGLADYQKAMELERPASRATYRVIHLEEMCRSLIQANADNDQAHAVLAWAHWRRGAKKEALDAAQKSLAIAPRNVAALVVRGRLRLEQKQWPEAESDFRSALAKDPQSYAAAAGLAEALEGQKKNEEALAAYDAALKIGPLDWQLAASNAGRTRILKALGR